MTDNEIIQALECCSIKHACSECPYTRNKGCGCINGILKDTLDLIKRQQSEIERLKYQVNRLKNYDERRDIDLHSRLIANARAEAIKEFAERLKEKIYIKKDINFYGKKINNLVKEMVGEE